VAELNYNLGRRRASSKGSSSCSSCLTSPCTVMNA